MNNARLRGAAIALLGFVLALGIVLALKPTGPADRQQMTTLCHGAVLARLKAPATAKFLPEDAIGGRVDKEDTFLQGAVDAENGFSALVRLDYRCELTKTAGHWAVTDVNLTQRS